MLSHQYQCAHRRVPLSSTEIIVSCLLVAGSLDVIFHYREYILESRCFLERGVWRASCARCNFIIQGSRVSIKGILPDTSGLEAVKQLKPPINLQQLDAFMGKVNYYCNFIPNFSQLASPLNQLRRKNVVFKFGRSQQQAFTALKAHILNATELAHFNEHLPLVLATDASSYGIGAVLSHTQADGSIQPNRKGSTFDCIWGKEIPSVPLRQKVYSHYGSQAIGHDIQPKQASAYDDFEQASTLGYNLDGIQL
ncbi:uncharacterized protein LOC121404561 [Drosophila obscura]|uniref:uncharacterized protein LOC121404561 n=1 Tax=Drosophila obscura TaxID=7282 RepID=UPI001BB1610E|nr:uncharacterized protein LOC121404561 [Drosophila obscura]